MEKLLKSINEKLEKKPLIYFSREVERALGLEYHLKNYHICCIEDSPQVDTLLKHGVSIFCAEREGIELPSKMTSNLLEVDKVQEWISNITQGESFYAMTFFP